MGVNYFVPFVWLTVMYARVGIELWGSRYIGEYNTQQAENVKSKRRVRTKLRYNKETVCFGTTVAILNWTFNLLLNEREVD